MRTKMNCDRAQQMAVKTIDRALLINAVHVTEREWQIAVIANMIMKAYDLGFNDGHTSAIKKMLDVIRQEEEKPNEN